MNKELGAGSDSNKTNRFFYGYVIVGAACCLQCVYWGTYQTFGIFYNFLTGEFGWSSAAISSAASVGWLLLSFMSVASGTFSDRFGPRSVASICGFIFGLGYILMSGLTDLWNLFLFYGLIIPMGMSSGDVVPLSTVARWFSRRRGIMTGITKIGPGIGMMIGPLLASQLIMNYGWRKSYVIIGIATALILLSLAQLLKRDPAEVGRLADGLEFSGSDISDEQEQGLSLKQAMRTKQIVMLCSGYFCIIFCVHTVMVHIVPHSINLGIPGPEAAIVFSAIGGLSIAARLAMGVVGDKFGNRVALTICFIPLVLALIWVHWAGNLWMMLIFSALYGFSHGGFFAVIPPLIAELFGTKSHGGLFGIVVSCGAVSGAVGPLMAGRIFDLKGSYTLAFVILALISILGLVFSLAIKPTNQK